MPRQTRKQAAEILIKIVEQGPQFNPNMLGTDYQNPSLATWNNERDGFPKQYQAWAVSWILPRLKRLLAKDLKEKQTKV